MFVNSKSLTFESADAAAGATAILSVGCGGFKKPKSADVIPRPSSFSIVHCPRNSEASGRTGRNQRRSRHYCIPYHLEANKTFNPSSLFFFEFLYAAAANMKCSKWGQHGKPQLTGEMFCPPLWWVQKCSLINCSIVLKNQKFQDGRKQRRAPKGCGQSFTAHWCT